MSKLKRCSKSHMKSKLSNTKKLSGTKESPLKEPSLTTTLLKLKSSTLGEKLRRLSWLRRQLRKSMKEFNISQFKLKLFTILRGKTMSQPRLKSELSMSNTKDRVNKGNNNKSRHQLLRLPKSKELLIKPMQAKADLESEVPMFQEEVELEFQAPLTSQGHTQQDSPILQLKQ